MSLEEKLAQAKLRQKKGEMIEAAEESGVPLNKEQPTEYAKSAKLVVDKMFDPYDEDDKQLLSSIPKNILPNTVMLVGIEHSIDKLYSGDLELYDPITKKITFYLNSDNQMIGNQSGLIKYRTVTERGYAHGKYWKQHWHGFIGGLFMQLPAVEGKSRQEGVQVVSAITNSDRALLEAQNNQNAGIFRKIWNKTFGGK